jgi:hypothetical protein
MERHVHSCEGFQQLMMHHHGILNITWFMDEARFHLSVCEILYTFVSVKNLHAVCEEQFQIHKD